MYPQAPTFARPGEPEYGGAREWDRAPYGYRALGAIPQPPPQVGPGFWTQYNPSPPPALCLLSGDYVWHRNPDGTYWALWGFGTQPAVYGQFGPPAMSQDYALPNWPAGVWIYTDDRTGYAHARPDPTYYPNAETEIAIKCQGVYMTGREVEGMEAAPRAIARHVLDALYTGTVPQGPGPSWTWPQAAVEIVEPTPAPVPATITGILAYRQPWPGIAQTHMMVGDVVILPSQAVGADPLASFDTFNAMRAALVPGDLVRVTGWRVFTTTPNKLAPESWALVEGAAPPPPPQPGEALPEPFEAPGIFDPEVSPGEVDPGWLDGPAPTWGPGPDSPGIETGTAPDETGEKRTAESPGMILAGMSTGTMAAAAVAALVFLPLLSRKKPGPQPAGWGL